MKLRGVLAIILTLVFLKPSCFSAEMVKIPAGSYLPFFPLKNKNARDASGISKKTFIPSFYLSQEPVTQLEFSTFLKLHPEWTQSQVKAIFSDDHYLAGFSSRDPRKGNQFAVTEVSWFAAKAYCESRGEELPTVDQWEYAAFDQGRERNHLNDVILKWYGQPTTQADIFASGGKPNGYGISNLYGLIWEWTLDFNSVIIDPAEGELYCASGSIGASDSSNFTSFMRQSFRSSLKANYSTKGLGFRCARNGGKE